MKTFSNQQEAIEYAMWLNAQEAYPVLIMFREADHLYRVGSRVEKEVRTFGKHIATANTLYGIQYDDCLLTKDVDHLHHTCLCE